MKNILAVVDYSEVTASVIELANEMARRFAAPLTLLHVSAPDPSFVGYDPGPKTVRDHMADLFHQKHRALQEHAERLRGEGLSAKALLVQGPTLETILREAAELGADFIVCGSHGHGALYDLILGSISEGIVRGANCPVLVVPSSRASSSASSSAKITTKT